MTEPAPQDPKLEAVNRFFYRLRRERPGRYPAGTPDDVRWTISDYRTLLGTRVGVPEVLSFFEQLDQVGFKAELLFLEASEEYVMDIHQSYSEGESKVDTLWALV